MTSILIVGTLGSMLLVLAMACRADRFLSGAVRGQESPVESTSVLLFGPDEAARCIENSGRVCVRINRPELPLNDTFSSLFAVSRSDADNLVLCLDKKKADPAAFLVVRCNLPEMRDVYQRAGADCILMSNENLSAQFLSKVCG